jgi:hypothetical protein
MREERLWVRHVDQPRRDRPGWQSAFVLRGEPGADSLGSDAENCLDVFESSRWKIVVVHHPVRELDAPRHFLDGVFSVG